MANVYLAPFPPSIPPSGGEAGWFLEPGGREWACSGDGEICGTVGAMNAEHILRLKNLVVRPSHRKKGVGRGTTLALWKMAFDSGKRLATFGATGGGGYATYKSAGLYPTRPQIEWCKKLSVE